jgi:creatinine amidohydrolase
MPETHRFEEMLPAEIEAEIRAHPVCYVPSGTLEWHSYHLPVGLDSLKAHALCEDVAVRAGGIVVPPTYWAIGGMPFPWTTKMEAPVVEALFAEIYRQLAEVGFRVIVVLAGHYSLEHYLTLKRVAVEVMRDRDVTILPLAEFEVVAETGFHGDHAARWETSLLWSVRPDLVHLDRLPEGPPEGVLGEDPRLNASREAGDRMRALIADRIAAMTRRLEEATSPDERRAYIEALATQVQVMEAVAAERRVKPKWEVTLLMTDEYIAYLECLRNGDYVAAAEHARAKLATLPYASYIDSHG